MPALTAEDTLDILGLAAGNCLRRRPRSGIHRADGSARPTAAGLRALADELIAARERGGPAPTTWSARWPLIARKAAWRSSARSHTSAASSRPRLRGASKAILDILAEEK